MIVHFPIAFLTAASLFALLYLFFQNSSFETTSFYLLVLGSISSPFAMATGLFTWWINYRLKLTYYVKRKIQLSILVLIFETILILWHGFGQTALQRIPPVYLILVLLLTPMVALLGYYGGQMTFPTEE